MPATALIQAREREVLLRAQQMLGRLLGRLALDPGGAAESTWVGPRERRVGPPAVGRNGNDNDERRGRGM